MWIILIHLIVVDNASFSLFGSRLAPVWPVLQAKAKLLALGAALVGALNSITVDSTTGLIVLALAWSIHEPSTPAAEKPTSASLGLS
jgi:hypothetical protein